MYTYFRPFWVITLNPAAKAIFLTVARMNLVRKQKMSGDPINVYLFSTVSSYHFKSSHKNHFLTVARINLVRKQKMSGDPINVYLRFFCCYFWYSWYFDIFILLIHFDTFWFSWYYWCYLILWYSWYVFDNMWYYLIL